MDHEGATYKTLRDEIAMRVLVEAMSGTENIMFWYDPEEKSIHSTATQAYRWADAMLKAREAE